MATRWTIFHSTDSGAPLLTGQVGTLTTLLNQCLCIGSVESYDSNAVTFTDNSAQSRLRSGGSAYKLFPHPQGGDYTAFRMQIVFSQLIVNLGTNGVANTEVLAWEYWNGAWVALTVTDGTTGLTASGTVSWTPPSDWVTTTVNSVTGYFVRVRLVSGAFTTAPLVQNATYLGWLQAFNSGASEWDYQQAPKAGFAQYYLQVNDNGPGAGTYQEARMVGFEAMTAFATGTNLIPTAAQLANGFFVRKSATLDGTARPWVLAADGRTLYLFVLTGDTASQYYTAAFGDFYSYLAGDQYNVFACGRTTENTGVATAEWLMGYTAGSPPLIGSVTGNYILRNYAGAAGALLVGKHVDVVKAGNVSAALGSSGALPLPNTVDSRAWVGTLWIHEIAQQTVRGYLRGLWAPLVQIAGLVDQDTITGADSIVNRTFTVFKYVEDANGAAHTYGQTAAILEISDTLDTN